MSGAFFWEKRIRVRAKLWLGLLDSTAKPELGPDKTDNLKVGLHLFTDLLSARVRSA
jgi:hypothetical protein